MSCIPQLLTPVFLTYLAKITRLSVHSANLTSLTVHPANRNTSARITLPISHCFYHTYTTLRFAFLLAHSPSFNCPSLSLPPVLLFSTRQVPAELGSLTHLRTLVLAMNPVARLPIELHRLRALDTLVLDGTSATLVFPPPDQIALESTAAVMRFLCAEAGVEWSAPSGHALASLQAAGGSSDPRATAVEAAQRAETEQIAAAMAVSQCVECRKEGETNTVIGASSGLGCLVSCDGCDSQM